MNETILGRRISMVDAVEKATGKAIYAVDVAWPGMLYGKILRSPYAHAKLLRIDVSAAEQLPGVAAVVTAADTSHVRFSYSQYADQTLFAEDVVRFVGEEIAAVAAVDLETAERALALIKIEYKMLPEVLDVDSAMAPGASLVHEDSPGNIAHKVSYKRGDIESAWARCEVIVEETFESSFAHPAYIEPQACVAKFDNQGNVDVYASTQSPCGAIQEKTASILGIPRSRINIHQTFVGGGFGGKNWQNVIPITVVLARKANRAVKIVYTRREDLSSTPPRVPMRMRLKMGADETGRILAKETFIIADNGAYNINAPIVVDTAATRIESLYRFENIDTTGILVYTNKIPTGTYRGFGNPQGTFMVESMLDIIAGKLGMDPTQIRSINATHSGYTSAHGWKMGSCELWQCIQKAKELSNWDEVKKNKRPYHGVGIACCIHVNGNRSVNPAFEGSCAYVRMDEEGCATVFVPDGDIGQGASTVYAQLTAETLSLPLDYVRVCRTESKNGELAFGAFASRITLNAGNAVLLAANSLSEQLLETAVRMNGSDALEGYYLQEGKIIGPKGWSCCIGTVALQYAYCHAGILPQGRGEYTPPGVQVADKKTKYGNISPAYSFAAHVAEVEVDPSTGKVELCKYYAVHDAGKLINPMLAEGQIEGGVVQGLGYALFENYYFNKEGRMLNNSFLDYKLPTSMDVPDFSIGFAESYEQNGPYGAKGLGEPTIVPVAAAIANAIFDATGIRLTEMPFSTERVYKALRDAGQDHIG